MLLLIDKPRGITSHDVVDVVRRITGERRVGHAGTLDPNATGLLIVAVGREDTKKLGNLTKNTTKTYIGEITLGSRTTTDDSEGEVVEQKPVSALTKEHVEEVLAQFTGAQKQIPPAYSAIRLSGKKAYELARSGQEVIMQPRDVTIHSLTLVSFTKTTITVECEVSSGTYIRSLARDIAGKLNTVGHLSALRRTRIGEYSLDNAVTLDTLKKEGVQ